MQEAREGRNKLANITARPALDLNQFSILRQQAPPTLHPPVPSILPDLFLLEETKKVLLPIFYTLYALLESPVLF